MESRHATGVPSPRVLLLLRSPFGRRRRCWWSADATISKNERNPDVAITFP